MGQPQLQDIYHAAAHGQPQQSIASAKLVCGRGLQGDRFFNQTGGVISLIEHEAIESFNCKTNLQADAGQMRRNLLTSGIALNPLVGQRFRIGDVELEGFELCVPCAKLGIRLHSDAVPAAKVVRLLADSGGLRAWVRSTGVIRRGMPIEVL